MKNKFEIKKFCLCKTRVYGIRKDNFGIEECGDCGFLLRKQPYDANLDGLRYRNNNNQEIIKKKTRRTFSKKEVMELIRFYCEHQRILCQFPVCSTKDRFITAQQNEWICDSIRIHCNFEKLRPLKKENFIRILEKIKKEKI